MTTRERVAQLVKAWPKVYPHAHCELDFRNPLELLVAAILSAQCTDRRVKMVTPALFKKNRTAKNYANASQVEFENAIKSTGVYRSKTKNICGAMRANRIAPTAKFSDCAPAVKFFCAPAKRRSPKERRLLNRCNYSTGVQRTARPTDAPAFGRVGRARHSGRAVVGFYAWEAIIP